jgi:hypothetical protein
MRGMFNDISDTGGNPQVTIAPVAVPAKTAELPVRPEFIRLPKSGLCPWTGLSRAKLNELILPTATNGKKPPVKSVCLRKPGAIKGARLIHLQSLLAYLRARMEGGEAEPPKTA